MAELDFAMLAEYARLDAAGLLTVVGGGFDRVQASGPGLVHRMSVAARIKLADDESGANFEIKIIPPGPSNFTMGISGVSTIKEGAQPVAGNAGVISVVDLGVPISEAGRYTVQFFIAGKLARELPFEVEFTSPAVG